MRLSSLLKKTLLSAVAFAASACAAAPVTDSETLTKATAALYTGGPKQASNTAHGIHGAPSIVSPAVATSSPVYGLTCAYSVVQTSSGKKVAVGRSTDFGSTWTQKLFDLWDPEAGDPTDSVLPFEVAATGRPGETVMVLSGQNRVWLEVFNDCDQTGGPNDHSIHPLTVWPDSLEESYTAFVRDVSVTSNPDNPGSLLVAWIQGNRHGDVTIRSRTLNMNWAGLVDRSWPPQEVPDSAGANTVTAFYARGSERAYAWAAGGDFRAQADACYASGLTVCRTAVTYRYAYLSDSLSSVIATDPNFELIITDTAQNLRLKNIPRVRAITVTSEYTNESRMIFAYNRSTPDSGMGAFIKSTGVSPFDPFNFVEHRLITDCVWDEMLDSYVCAISPSPEHNDVGVGLAAWVRPYDQQIVVAPSTIHIYGNGTMRPVSIASDDAGATIDPWVSMTLLGADGSAYDHAGNRDGRIIDATHLLNYSAPSQCVAWDDVSQAPDPQQIVTEYMTPF